MAKLTNAQIVSKALGFRVHASNPSKVFAVLTGRSEVVFSVVCLKGTCGRPRRDQPSGYGVNTLVVLQTLGKRGKKLQRKVMDLSELVNNGVTYLGTKETVFGV